MRTARLPTFLVLVAATRCQYYEGGGITSEQVWTGLQWRPPDVSSMGLGSQPLPFPGQGSWGTPPLATDMW